MNVDTARKPELVAAGVRLGLGSKALWTVTLAGEGAVVDEDR